MVPLFCAMTQPRWVTNVEWYKKNGHFFCAMTQPKCRVVGNHIVTNVGWFFYDLKKYILSICSFYHFSLALCKKGCSYTTVARNLDSIPYKIVCACFNLFIIKV